MKKFKQIMHIDHVRSEIYYKVVPYVSIKTWYLLDSRIYTGLVRDSVGVLKFDLKQSLVKYAKT